MVRAMEKYLRPGVKSTPFCPGCGHGILMGLILRAIDESKMDMKKMLFISGIGCAGWIPSRHLNGDTLHTLHGRALVFATAAKLYNPDLCVTRNEKKGEVKIDLEYCKGCGICAVVCPKGAIRMGLEEGI
jgi:pyruvate/2-oxoacid:ferredoxin oxidoreductase beta subunit